MRAVSCSRDTLSGTPSPLSSICTSSRNERNHGECYSGAPQSYQCSQHLSVPFFPEARCSRGQKKWRRLRGPEDQGVCEGDGEDAAEALVAVYLCYFVNDGSVVVLVNLPKPVILSTIGLNFLSHRSQDLYPTYLKTSKNISDRHATVATTIGNCVRLLICVLLVLVLVLVSSFAVLSFSRFVPWIASSCYFISCLIWSLFSLRRY